MFARIVGTVAIVALLLYGFAVLPEIADTWVRIVYVASIASSAAMLISFVWTFRFRL